MKSYMGKIQYMVLNPCLKEKISPIWYTHKLLLQYILNAQSGKLLSVTSISCFSICSGYALSTK